jgi:peptidoglycan hydrolase-like protein with peptidoglycan-binding domain
MHRTTATIVALIALTACAPLALAPAASARRLTVGMNGLDVRHLKSDLADRGYLPRGAVSKDFDQRTWHAVVALQGWQGLSRDGVAGPRTRKALKVAVRPVPSSTRSGIEIHVRAQVLLIVRNGRTRRAVHVSTGAGDRTPYGHFGVYSRQRMSWSRPFQTWMPFAQYFSGGYAMHEYPNVPAYAASHGCVRLPAQETRVVWRYGHVGERVWVVAGHASSRR